MTVVRVLVVRTGGFAGIERTAEVDDPADAGRIAAALRARDARVHAPSAVRDGFRYAITVVTTTGSETVETTDGRMGEDLRGAVHALFAR